MKLSPLVIAKEELAGEEAWLVGGAVRDELLGAVRAEEATDLDLALGGDPAIAAEALRRRAGAGVAAFQLSDEFGGWRVAGEGWQVDCIPLQGGGLEEDLRSRDLTINAIARPLAGGDLVDPTGGVSDLEGGVLRMAGPGSFGLDPLRVLRLARFAAQLGMEAEPSTLAAAAQASPGLVGVAAERVFQELSLLLSSGRPRVGLELVARTGAEEEVLPELTALRGVEQTRYHHLDAHGHIAKPLTRVVSDEGRVGFPGHDREGARMAREILGRLRASDRLAGYVAAITGAHLLLGFLVHQQPIDAGTRFDYLSACDPVEVDVTLLSVADRLATRGRKADEAIAAHMAVATPMLLAALDWRRDGRPSSPIPGDELAGELGIEPGPQLGELLRGVERAVYTGEVQGRGDAVTWARSALTAG